MSLYTLFRNEAARGKGNYTYPEMIYIRRVYQTLINDVKTYYAKAPKAVDSQNLLANILLHIPIRMDYSDHLFARFVEDITDGLIRGFGLTNSSFKGKVHEGITLGPLTQEVLISTYEDFDYANAKKNWRRLSPVKYLYHTRTDVNLPIMNNSMAGKGYGVTSVNVPMMAVQYRYWLREQVNVQDQKDSVNRFIGSYVLPNAIDSYLDIAFFNRISRMANGVGTPTYPSPHPFYITDMVPRLERVAQGVLEKLLFSKDIQAMTEEVPMITQVNLRHAIQLPKDPVTRQNEWTFALARLPYVKFLIQKALDAKRTDRSPLNEVQVSLLEAKWANLHGQISHPELAKLFKQQLEGVIGLLK